MTTRHLMKEARKRLKKKAKFLDEKIVQKIESDLTELDKVRKTGGKKKITSARNRVMHDINEYLPKKTMDVVKEYVISIGVSIIIALAIRHFFIEPFKIPSGSMETTLLIKDKIVVYKLAYGPKYPFSGKRFLWENTPERWDIVVFTTKNIQKASDYPKNFVKRVVGLPGEEIEIKDGEIYANGKLMKKPKQLQRRGVHYSYAPEDRPAGYKTYDYGLNLFGWHLFPKVYTERFVPMGNWEAGFEGKPFTVPEGHYFVLGDNSNHSYDSRGWGFVPFENIKGKVVAIWWPLNRVRVTH